MPRKDELLERLLPEGDQPAVSKQTGFFSRVQALLSSRNSSAPSSARSSALASPTPEQPSSSSYTKL